MVPMLSGPIPNHPMYSKEGALNENSRPCPRVRPEAKEYAQNGTQGTMGKLFEVRGNSITVGASAFSRSKKVPKDHVSDNVRRMRQIQKQCKQKLKEDERKQPVPVKALWKSDKYADVPSKMNIPLCADGVSTPRPRSANFLLAHSKTGNLPSRPGSARRPEPGVPVERLEGVGLRPSSSMSDLRIRRSSDFDFIKINGYAARHSMVKRCPSVQSLNDCITKKEEAYSDYKRTVKGTIPKYLQQRKDQWKREEAERIQNIPDPDMPPGHKSMPNSERLETLDLLRKRQTDLMQKLGSLPIRNDTFRVRSAKDDLEKKIREVDEAIKVMSQPKVFVKIDE